MGCNIFERNVETRQVRNLGDTSQTHIDGSRKIRQQTPCWNYVEQEVEAKNYLLTLNTSTNGPSLPPTHQTDECVLHPLGICRP